MSDRLRYLTPRERQDDERMRRSMANHVATYRVLGEGEDRVELLTWGEPGTGVYRVRYIAHGPRLFVAGDMGSAVYCREAGLAWWASLYPNFGYFTEKCDASESGRHAREYDADAVREAVRAYFVDAARTARGPHGDDRDRDDFRTARRVWREAEGDYAVDNPHDWLEWRRQHGPEVFGQDWWDMGSLDGMVVSYRARFHLLGLYLAMQQISARGETPAQEAA